MKPDGDRFFAAAGIDVGFAWPVTSFAASRIQWRFGMRHRIAHDRMDEVLVLFRVAGYANIRANIIAIRLGRRWSSMGKFGARFLFLLFRTALALGQHDAPGCERDGKENQGEPENPFHSFSHCKHRPLREQSDPLSRRSFSENISPEKGSFSLSVSRAFLQSRCNSSKSRGKTVGCHAGQCTAIRDSLYCPVTSRILQKQKLRWDINTEKWPTCRRA